MEMSGLDVRRTIDGIDLEVWFQYYASDRPGAVPSGELLTRPVDSAITPQGYFAGLSVDHQIDVLDWHIEVKEQLHEVLGVHVSINIHNSVVERSEDQRRFLRTIDALPTRATFEFTEIYPMPPARDSNRLLAEIRDRGHRSAVDDFGSGLNGMTLLTDFDFDVIKLDRSLSYDLVDRPDKVETLRTLAKILAALGRDHVVEGIERADVLEIVRPIGYDTFQGFLLHRPQRIDELLSEGSEMSS